MVTRRWFVADGGVGPARYAHAVRRHRCRLRRFWSTRLRNSRGGRNVQMGDFISTVGSFVFLGGLVAVIFPRLLFLRRRLHALAVAAVGFFLVPIGTTEQARVKQEQRAERRAEVQAQRARAQAQRAAYQARTAAARGTTTAPEPAPERRISARESTRSLITAQAFASRLTWNEMEPIGTFAGRMPPRVRGQAVGQTGEMRRIRYAFPGGGAIILLARPCGGVGTGLCVWAVDLE